MTRTVLLLILIAASALTALHLGAVVSLISSFRYERALRRYLDTAITEQNQQRFASLLDRLDEHKTEILQFLHANLRNHDLVSTT